MRWGCEINKHGLSRYIPAEIKRIVRQHCGFGCVVCGLGIIQYEHVDPEFCEAKSHEIENITLLCPQCHGKVTTGFLSKEKIKQAMNNPICNKNGFTKEVFDFCTGHPTLQFAGMLFSNCSIPIMVAGNPLFKIERPEIEGGPFRLSGIFCNSAGQCTLKIQENEWIASSTNWDVEVAGGKIIVRRALGEIHLKLRVNPPKELIVEKLDMRLGRWCFKGNKEKLIVTDPCGNENVYRSCFANNCQVGMSLG